MELLTNLSAFVLNVIAGASVFLFWIGLVLIMYTPSLAVPPDAKDLLFLLLFGLIALWGHIHLWGV